MPNPFEKDIEKLIKFDPLHQAEKIIGESYKTNISTTLLGIMLAKENSQNKRDVLEFFNDSTYGTEIKKYIEIIEDIGFVKINEHPFVDTKTSGKKEEEALFIYWHPKYSILLTFDSYGGKHNGACNGGCYYYNWKSNPNVESNEFISTGYHFPVFQEKDLGYTQYIISGSHDCREAIRHTITRMADNGEFLKKWVDRPNLHLNHYMDYEINRSLNSEKSGDYSYCKEKHMEREIEFPVEVFECINPPEKTNKEDFGTININFKKSFGNEITIHHNMNGVNFYIVAKVFKEPSKFGINNGRISELSVTESSNYENVLIEYKRGEYFHNSIDPNFLEEILSWFPEEKS